MQWHYCELNTICEIGANSLSPSKCLQCPYFLQAYSGSSGNNVCFFLQSAAFFLTHSVVCMIYYAHWVWSISEDPTSQPFLSIKSSVVWHWSSRVTVVEEKSTDRCLTIRTAVSLIKRVSDGQQRVCHFLRNCCYCSHHFESIFYSLPDASTEREWCYSTSASEDPAGLGGFKQLSPPNRKSAFDLVIFSL